MKPAIAALSILGVSVLLYVALLGRPSKVARPASGDPEAGEEGVPSTTPGSRRRAIPEPDVAPSWTGDRAAVADPANEARRGAPDEETRSSLDDMESVGLRHLERLREMELGGELLEASRSELRALRYQIWEIHSALCDQAFEELSALSLYETRAMPGPVSSRDLEELYDCAFGWTSGEPGPDGIEIVEVYPYPRDRYPTLNELKDWCQRLAELESSRKAAELGLK